MKRIALHTMTYLNTDARISTVKLSDNCYETTVMFDYGEELECYHTTNATDAARKHNEVMRSWNDLLWECSTARLLGVPNLGQFVHTVVAC